MFETVIPLMLCILPLIIFYFFWPRVYKFNREKENKKYLQIIYDEFEKGVFPHKSPKNAEYILRKKNIVGHHREKFLRNYRELYYWVVTYCITVVLGALFWLGYIIMDFLIFNWSHSKASLLLIVSSGIYIFGLGMPPLLKSVGGNKSKKLATIIDQCMHLLSDPEGKVTTIILKVASTCFLLIFNMFSFWGYLLIGEFIIKILSKPHDLVSVLVILCVYQYFLVNYVLVPFAGKLFRYIVGKRKLFAGEKIVVFNPEYIKETFKNNTYVLFLLIYIMGKFLQVDFESEAGIMIEAIGIVYLIDTYFEKRGKCEEMQRFL